MPYKVSWLVENRIIFVKYTGKMTRADLEAYLAESFAMRDAANAALGPNGALVHTITDAMDVEGFEMNLGDIQRMMKALRRQRVGWSIYVSANKAETFMASLGHQFAGVRYRGFTSVRDAIGFLRQSDETLAGILRPMEDDEPV